MNQTSYHNIHHLYPWIPFYKYKKWVLPQTTKISNRSYKSRIIPIILTYIEWYDDTKGKNIYNKHNLRREAKNWACTAKRLGIS